MVVLSRIIAALAYAGAAFLFGLALGERGELGAVQYAFSIVVPVATLVLAFIARNGRPEVLATGAAMFAGLWLGQRAFDDAFARCPAEVAPIRAAIVEQQTRTGDYPPRLQDLGVELPCDCILRKTILHYSPGDRGFRLWMSNDREQREFGRRRATAT